MWKWETQTKSQYESYDCASMILKAHWFQGEIRLWQITTRMDTVSTNVGQSVQVYIMAKGSHWFPTKKPIKTISKALLCFEHKE